MTTHVHHNWPYRCYELVFFVEHIVRGELFWIFHVRICMAFYAKRPWVFGLTIFGQYQFYFAAVHITEKKREKEWAVGWILFVEICIFFLNIFSLIYIYSLLTRAIGFMCQTITKNNKIFTDQRTTCLCVCARCVTIMFITLVQVTVHQRIFDHRSQHITHSLSLLTQSHTVTPFIFCFNKPSNSFSHY